MIRYVPDFVLRQLSLGKHQGSFKGFVLLLDIVDFTGVVEELQGEGQRGADEVGKLLNMIGEGPLKAIHRHQGFVSLFIGDAVCAVFEGENPDNLLLAIQEIDAGISALEVLESVSERRHIALHKAISFGEITWEIFPTDHQYEYLFSGKPFVEVNEMISLHSEVQCTEVVQAILGDRVG